MLLFCPAALFGSRCCAREGLRRRGSDRRFWGSPAQRGKRPAVFPIRCPARPAAASQFSPRCVGVKRLCGRGRVPALRVPSRSSAGARIPTARRSCRSRFPTALLSVRSRSAWVQHRPQHPDGCPLASGRGRGVWGIDGLLGGTLRHKKKPPFQGAFAAAAPARPITLHDRARWAWGGLDIRPGKDIVACFDVLVKASSCFFAAGGCCILRRPLRRSHRPNRL